MFGFIGFFVFAAVAICVGCAVYTHYHAKKTKTFAVQVGDAVDSLAAKVESAAGPEVAADVSKAVDAVKAAT